MFRIIFKSHSVKKKLLLDRTGNLFHRKLSFLHELIDVVDILTVMK